MIPCFRLVLGAFALCAALAPSGVSAQELAFSGTTDQGVPVFVSVTPATADSPAFGFFTTDYFAMRCGGGKVRYGAGAFGGDSPPQSDGAVRWRQWDRDTRMTAEITVAPDGLSVTGSFTIAQPVIRDPRSTSDAVSRCTTGKVGFAAQIEPPPVQERP